ncbi:MAG: DNA repair protein RecO [Eubacteriales bacterium]|nr:DNA repair protein RecO [Eubacteriales bacterium]
MQQITDAIVLRRADWRDYDRMVTLLTPGGRIDAVARGCRRPKSPLLAAAEPFTAGEYALYESKGRYTIEQFRATDTFYPLRMDYDRLLHGAYWLRLAEMQAMPEQDQSGLFHLLLRALAHLAYSELAPELLTMAFELHYLALLGLAPRMDECVRCGKAVDAAAWFDAEGGGVACEVCKRALPEISNGARRIMLRTPMVRFDNAAKLDGHPDLEEAQRCTRLFLRRRVDLHAAGEPEMPL